MGWRFEVHSWEFDFDANHYHWVLVYGGQSIWKAVWKAIREKRKTQTAVKLEWR